MKTPARKLCFGTALAFASALIGATVAHSADEKDAPGTPPAAPAPAVAPVPPEPTPGATPAPATASGEKSELRRLDRPDAEAKAAPDKTDEEKEQVATDESAQKEAAPQPAEDPGRKAKVKNLSFGYRKHHHEGNAKVTIGGNSTLPQGEEADAVVSVFGSSTAEGTVSDAVVSVLGSSTSSGEVGDAVVSILGSTRVTGGRVGQAAVAVLGDTYVNGHVRDAAVAVLGNVELGPDAEVGGDVVSVGGTVKRDPHAIVHGHIQNVAVGPVFGGVGGLDWLQAWVHECLLHARPLAFGPHLMWAWWIALGFLALYALIALLFGGAVEKCAQTIEQKPGYSLLAAVLTVLITPVAIILLCITVVGVALVPFIAAGLFFAGIFGKVVMLAWIGRRFTKLLGGGAKSHAAVAVLIGGVVVLLLYTVPIVGFVVYKLIGVLGLGVVVYTLLLSTKRKPAPPGSTSPAASGAAPGPVAPVVPPTAAGVVPPAISGPEATAPEAPVSPSAPPPVAAPPLVTISASTQGRAGFWIRLAASVLDALIVGLAIGLLPHVLRPSFLLLFAAYCIVLWALKGTTVGGIVCSLKVVRLDDRPVDWMTALVRGLSGFLSLFSAGLGFIWVAFDDQKQSWHDKIAGTTIVVVPKGVSLV